MKQNVKKSYLMKKWPVYSIPNAINTKKWKPVDKNLSRKTLKLPNELSLILFGSTSGTKDYHKGFDLLEKSLEKLQNLDKKLDWLSLAKMNLKLNQILNFQYFIWGF